MKRLTKEANNGMLAWYTKNDSGLPEYVAKTNPYREICEKLKAYEDLEEQCIKENAIGIKLLLEKWKEFLEDMQELAEYRKLKDQGRLFILPCAVGDTVYAIMIVGLEFGRLKYQVYEAKVVRHHIDSFHLCVEMITENGQRIELVAETFGETVFLTRAEAEAALEKMKGE